MDRPNNDANTYEGFELGKPALVCRWRLAGGKLPLENRHLRALAARTVAGERVSTELVAWAKQHLEWTLTEGSRAYPDGVLMLVVDDQGRAAMTAGPYAALEACDVAALAARAHEAHREAQETGVAPEALWAVQGQTVLCDVVEGAYTSGAQSLIGDLARTLRMQLEPRAGLLDAVQGAPEDFDEVFLVSDEHGVVAAQGRQGSVCDRFVQGYAKLLEAQRARA